MGTAAPLAGTPVCSLGMLGHLLTVHHTWWVQVCTPERPACKICPSAGDLSHQVTSYKGPEWSQLLRSAVLSLLATAWALECGEWRQNSDLQYLDLISQDAQGYWG